MNNLFVKALITSTLGTALAYLLNSVLDYTENTLSYWLGLWIAVTMGLYIGFKIHKSKKSK